MIRLGLQRQGLGTVSLPPPPHKGVLMSLKIEGFVYFLTPGKIQSSCGRMEEKDKILLPASPQVKTNKLWEEWEKDQLLLACRKYGTKVLLHWVFRDKA